MKYYTFKEQFHAAILGGVKVSTIRPKRKVEPGERFALRCWTGAPYRSKMGWLGSAVCTRVSVVQLSALLNFYIDVNGERLDYSGRTRLAEAEGFSNLLGMWQWFIDQHKINEKPLVGVLTEWDPSTFIAGEAQS